MELSLEGQSADRADPIPRSLTVPRPTALATTFSLEGDDPTGVMRAPVLEMQSALTKINHRKTQ